MEVELSVTGPASGFKGGRRRRCSTSSSGTTNSLSPNPKDRTPKRRKRNHSAQTSKRHLTFLWGWSPKQSKFKPQIMDSEGGLVDHPNPESVGIKSKWQPIVILIFIL